MNSCLSCRWIYAEKYLETRWTSPATLTEAASTGIRPGFSWSTRVWSRRSTCSSIRTLCWRACAAPAPPLRHPVTRLHNLFLLTAHVRNITRKTHTAAGAHYLLTFFPLDIDLCDPYCAPCLPNGCPIAFYLTIWKVCALCCVCVYTCVCLLQFSICSHV